MTSRKIQLVGKRSYAISLPKAWVLTNNLKPKDEIHLKENKDNTITITTTGSPAPEGKKTFSLSEISDINNFLAFCYQKNIETLEITAKKFDNKKRSTIRGMLEKLEGYDIVSETPTKITISFLFKGVNINVNNIITRMIYLLKLMVESINEHSEFTLSQNENAIDRLYHLGQRILFACAYNDKARQNNDIKSTEDIFFNLYIIKKLEHIGDTIEELGEYEHEEKTISHIKTCIEHLETLFIKKQKPSNHLQKLRGLKQPKTKNQTLAIHLDRLQNLCIDATLNALSIEYNNTHFNQEK